MSPANVTINDVARAAGVSKSLVSLTLNARPGVASETRERILRTARELGWTPHPGARGLSTRRAYALGLVLRREPRTIEVDPFFASFIAGVETVLAERGNVLVLTVVPDRAAEERAYERLVADKRVDGFLLTDLLAADDRIPLISRLGSYAVSLGEPPGGSPFPVITRDYDAGIDDLVQHLVRLGHRRIAHVSGDERMLHGLRRRERFELAAAAAGITPVVVTTDFSPEQGAEATKALLETEDRPTAIVYGNDPMAIAGMGVAHERGLDLPAELSITGLDGSHIGSFVYPPSPPSTNDPAGWGTAAATALLRLVEDGEPGDVALPPARLVVRASTAPPSAG